MRTPADVADRRADRRVCGWQPAVRKGRCNACRLFLMRHGRDKEPREIQRGWERAIDKAFDLKGTPTDDATVTRGFS